MVLNFIESPTGKTTGNPAFPRQSPKELAKMFVSLEGYTLGKYRVMEPLGKGGMAQVYRAFHPQLERYVAIKVLRTDLVEEEEFLARFQREARAVAGLRHPNIVQVYDFDAHENVYYMVMELLEGDTLKAYENAFRARGTRMPWGEMLRIMMDILEGLQYAHDENLIHRDLKPANIMLTRKGQAVITDFGVAQIIGGTKHTASGALMGTLSYMAPEQGMQGLTSPQSDIYSLGVVFYEMLTGKTPFEADTPLAILMKHLNDPLPLPRTLDPDIPEPLERILLKALAKQPADRYPSAREMAAALQQAAEEIGASLPQKLSLPETLTGAGLGAVGIFSGPAKAALPASAFVQDDTEAYEAVETVNNPRPPTMSYVGVKENPLSFARLKPWQAALVGAGILACVNLCNLSLAGFTQNWNVYTYGWPIQICLPGVFFFLLSYSLASEWLLIPGFIFTGTGLLMTYYAVSNNWTLWVYLWPLQLFVILGAVASPFIVRALNWRNPGFTRFFGGVMSGLTLLFLLTLNVVAFILPFEFIQRFF
ncbi:MAG: serine/threonine protein kinase [Anaerolineales bacterium]|nr:serine/threonine protein kinase [Anaerolineales bacterium]